MNYVRLSKELSYMLRHAPWEYELELDENGWVDTQQVLSSLQEENQWQYINENDLVLADQTSDKKRFEIHEGKIRASYGHSFPTKITKEPVMPPDMLYHGTARQFLKAIMEQGLLPKGRQYVHMSSDTGTALQVGKRRDMKPTLLKIQAKRAWDDGIKFYHANGQIWLADSIPGKYITFDS